MSADIKGKQHSKACILATAAKLFSKLGLANTSTRDISKESEANISLISYHFGGKEGLYKEVIKEFALKIQTQFQDDVIKLKSVPLTREVFIAEIDKIITHIIEMRVNHPEISIILSREKIEGMPYAREIHEELIYPLIKNFLELFAEAQNKNIVRKEIDPAVFFIFLTEGVWGFYEMLNCKVSISQACESYLQDQNKLKKQIFEMILTGVLV